uniref:Uncharacterized protein n=1 Tax=Timema shepardi TaxID=629360 RepID=A0A7R9AUH6_TIMSH|nr:unnamed protein product [Timema shepardi]
MTITRPNALVVLSSTAEDGEIRRSSLQLTCTPRGCPRPTSGRVPEHPWTWGRRETGQGVEGVEAGRPHPHQYALEKQDALSYNLKYLTLTSQQDFIPPNLDVSGLVSKVPQSPLTAVYFGCRVIVKNPRSRTEISFSFYDPRPVKEGNEGEEKQAE